MKTINSVRQMSNEHILEILFVIEAHVNIAEIASACKALWGPMVLDGIRDCKFMKN